MKGREMRDTKAISSEHSARFGKAELGCLGRYLLKQRRAAGFTLQRMSELTGVGVASIRALESGRSSPSLTTVLRVVDALGLTVDRAISEALTAGARVVVTRGAQVAGNEGLLLSEGLEDATLDARRMTISPGAICKPPASLSDSATFCMVIDGTLIAATEGADRTRLAAGDNYLARSGVVQAWANAGDVPVNLICVADRTRSEDGA